MKFYLGKFFVLLFYPWLWLGWGCSQVHTLNLKPHTFSDKGKQVFWLQVAGFSEEHVALLKFDKKDMNYQTEFEKFQCLGKIWSYNYFSLRPSPDKGFFSQIVGSKDIQGQCQDLKHQPIWKILKRSQFNVTILEGQGTGSYSLSKKWNCHQGKAFFEGVSLIKMESPKKKSKWFHYQRKKNVKHGILYDRSCRKKRCFSSLSNNVEAIWKILLKREKPQLFIVRDFSFHRALKEKNLKKARKILYELNKTIALIKKYSSSKNLSILLTTTSPLLFEFPRQGKSWRKFEKTGKNVIFRKSSLLSSAWAEGLGSENFCGFYEESDILKRILWGPQQDSLYRGFFD